MIFVIFWAWTNTCLFPSTSVCFFSYLYCSPISTSSPLNSWSKIARLVKQNFLVKGTPLVSRYDLFREDCVFFFGPCLIFWRFDLRCGARAKPSEGACWDDEKKRCQWDVAARVVSFGEEWWLHDNSCDDFNKCWEELRTHSCGFSFSIWLGWEGVGWLCLGWFFQPWRMKEKTTAKKAGLCMEGSCDLSR